MFITFVLLALISLVENERPSFIKEKKNTRGVDLEIMLTALGYHENRNDDEVIAKTNKQNIIKKTHQQYLHVVMLTSHKSL